MKEKVHMKALYAELPAEYVEVLRRLKVVTRRTTKVLVLEGIECLASKYNVAFPTESEMSFNQDRVSNEG